MNRFAIPYGLFLYLCVSTANADVVTVIDFEQLPGVGNVGRGFQYAEQGFEFSILGAGSLQTIHPGSPEYRGSVTLDANRLSGIFIYREESTLLTFDLFAMFVYPKSTGTSIFDIVGNGPSGRITERFTNTGNQRRTLLFDHEWRDVQTVQWGTSEFYLDGIQVAATAIPEPSSVALLGCVGFLLLFRRRR